MNAHPSHRSILRKIVQTLLLVLVGALLGAILAGTAAYGILEYTPHSQGDVDGGSAMGALALMAGASIIGAIAGAALLPVVLLGRRR